MFLYKRKLSKFNNRFYKILYNIKNQKCEEINYLFFLLIIILFEKRLSIIIK